MSEVYDPSLYDPDLLPPYVIYTPVDYRDGPEGFIKWCEDNVFIPIYPDGSDIAVWVGIGSMSSDIHPKSGKSYNNIWERQKEECRKALRMVKGRFVYRLIILSWMRGEGKSLLACLIQLWKFFCWPKQQIVLGANSRDQVRFVHFDIMRDIVKNSPRLLATIGERNLQEKEIRLRDASGNIASVLRPISSFSGIVSNITGYTFSEVFDMKNPRFFTQLDGSIRNIPNAFGVIDSTVSPKTHFLYKMYENSLDGKIKTLYFSYRCSKNADVADYWNPQMDQQQLDDYKLKFPLGEFEQYFMNTWSSQAAQVFSEEMVFATNILGVDGKIAPYSAIKEVVAEVVNLKTSIEEIQNLRVPLDEHFNYSMYLAKHKAQKERLFPVSSVYSLIDRHGNSRSADMHDLQKLSDLYDTEFAILVGLDRADPLKGDRSAARTIVTVLAKGLPSSKSNPFLADDGNPAYIYIVLNIAHIMTSSLEDIKTVILDAHQTFDGIDAICAERWGLWDIVAWCEEQNIKFELVHPSYALQQAAFSELYGATATGRFKIPPLQVWGSTSEDVLKEELLVFNHDQEKRWFGSPEKTLKKGIQDDSVFSIGWCMYGGRNLRRDDFRERGSTPFFGTMCRNRDTLQWGIERKSRL